MTRFKTIIVALFFCAGLLIYFSSTPRTDAQGAPPVPTGVAATDAVYANKVGVTWHTMRGATTYRVFRGTTNDPNLASEIGTTAANFYFDSTGTPGQNYFYWVKSASGASVSGFSNGDSGSVGVPTFPTGQFPALDPPTAPTENPITAAKAYLGKALFWDEQLSSTNTVSCGTCHRPGSGGSDPRTTFNSSTSRNPGFDGVFGNEDDVFGSPGVPLNNADGTYTFSSNYKFNHQVTGRKAPSYLNGAFTRGGLFWDGRATDIFRDPLTNNILINAWGSLESQSMGPPMSDAEMAHQGRNWTQAAAKMATVKPLALASNIPAPLAAWINGRTYPQLFEEAFGTPDVTPARIALAIGTHERILFSDQAPIDRVAVGLETLTEQELRGQTVFTTQLCNFCHGGSLFSDNNYHNIGVRPQLQDVGRGAITNNPDDNGRYKSPTLRNVELRAPFMHNGRFPTIEDVVEFYNRGGDFDAPNIDHNVIRPLNLLPGERADLAAFMKRPLTDPRVRDELPPFDRPQLYTESTRVPVITGTGAAGTGGQIPVPTAIEPPLVGNPSFTVAVSNALGGANAVLVINSTDPGTGSIPASGSFLRQQIGLGGSGAGNGNGSISVAIPDNPALVGQTFFGRWYVTDPGGANGFSVTPAFRFTVFGEASAVSSAAHVDFDGDRKTDISIYRPSVGEWWYSASGSGQTRALTFGVATDKIVPADYSGDGKTDIAIWRESTGTWFILRSEDNSFYSLPFGTAGDIPAPGDFDGDGKADTTVYRPSTGTWFAQTLTQGTKIVQFGAPGDQPQAGDYDADGKSDFAVFRPNGVAGAEWWINRSATNVTVAATFGVSTDKPVAQDFSGDGRADIAFFRPSTGEWFVLRSEDGSYFSVPFGTAGDIAAPGDYDGDGKADTAVFRPSTATWYVNRTTQGVLIATFGATGDQPAPNAYVR